MLSCRTEVSRVGLANSRFVTERTSEEASEAPRRTFAELLIDCEEDRTLRAVLVGPGPARTATLQRAASPAGSSVWLRQRRARTRPTRQAGVEDQHPDDDGRENRGLVAHPPAATLRNGTTRAPATTERRLYGLVLNPIPDSEPRGRWPVWRGPRRIGRERHRDDENRIADGQAEESSEVGAVPFVTLERVELCDASS
jgi:hypothetical protein